MSDLARPMRLLDGSALTSALNDAAHVVVEGRVTRISGLLIEATLPQAAIGAGVVIDGEHGAVAAEVVGFSGSRALLMPVHETLGLREGARVRLAADASSVPVSSALLGRVVDPMLQPLDGKPLVPGAARAPLNAPAPSPMRRRRIQKVLATGVRAIDVCLTIGEGQRVGIMAGAGVGKSVLLGMLARSADADVIVTGLVGERGREVREFVERDLGPEGLKKSVVIVATSDQPPLLRLRAALSATAVAEHFRREGKRVLLLVDSLTRVAMAQREIGLSAEEPPTTKGYPPSVFFLLPRLLERAGNDEGQGSITALYTVLVEGDDLSDPIADSARSVLDGHIVLSRKMAGGGHFPAIDILQSASRVMTDVCEPAHLDTAMKVRDSLAAYAESADLIEVGAYVKGSNLRVDQALERRPALLSVLKQKPDERSALSTSLDAARAALATVAPPQLSSMPAPATPPRKVPPHAR